MILCLGSFLLEQSAFFEEFSLLSYFPDTAPHAAPTPWAPAPKKNPTQILHCEREKGADAILRREQAVICQRNQEYEKARGYRASGYARRSLLS